MAIEILNLAVHGMTCGNCARSVERKLSATPGVTKVTVELEKASATVEYDVNLVKPDVIANAVRQLGYEVPVPS
jgi:copper chaperone CopZ